MFRVLGVILVVAVASAMSYDGRSVTGEVFTGPISETGLMHCEECFASSTQHMFAGLSCGSESSPSCYDCHAFNACHTNAQAGTCSEFHQACHGDGFALESALGSGDREEVRALLASTEGRVAFNEARRALQLKDCHGHLVAHYPISARYPQKLWIAIGC